MDSNWAVVFVAHQQYQIEIIKGMLEEQGIDSVVFNKQDSAYQMGEIELYVHVENAFRAKQIIEENNSE